MEQLISMKRTTTHSGLFGEHGKAVEARDEFPGIEIYQELLSHFFRLHQVLVIRNVRRHAPLSGIK